MGGEADTSSAVGPRAFARFPQAALVCAVSSRRKREFGMLGWALTFLIVALIAAAFGFTGIAGAATSIAQILFFIFLVFFAVAVIVGLVRGRKVEI
jgi:uncharacterized membrane protein YtjA (UPF0391 family)